MLETFKKHVTKNLIGRIVLSAIIIGAVFFFSGKSILMFLKGPVPITAGMDYDAAEGTFVSFDAQYIIDEYVRLTERNTDTKKEKLKNISYFVYYKEDGYFFGIEVPSSQEEEMNQYIDDTISWLNEEVSELTNVKSVKGTWTALTGKRLQYYQEQITDDLGAEFLDMALPYYIDTNNVGERTYVSIYICLAVIALAIIFLIYSLVQYFTGSSQKKLKKYLEANPTVTMENLEADFASATAVSGNIWVGRRWTFRIAGIYADLLENKNLVWGYYYYRSGRHSESALRLYDINQHEHSLNAAEKQATAALNIYKQQQPHMVIGYQKDLEQLYRKDFQGFLNLRYNRPAEELQTALDEPWNYTNPEE